MSVHFLGTTDQIKALNSIRQWLRDPWSQIFTLHGFAGTGKTQIAQRIGAMVDGRILYSAFTGKAARVMQERGCGAAA